MNVTVTPQRLKISFNLQPYHQQGGQWLPTPDSLLEGRCMVKSALLGMDKKQPWHCK